MKFIRERSVSADILSFRAESKNRASELEAATWVDRRKASERKRASQDFVKAIGVLSRKQKAATLRGAWRLIANCDC